MSFRNPFVTDFIYQASDDVVGFNAPVREVFKKYAAVLSSEVDERGYGYYAGWLKSLDGSIEDSDIKELANELEKVAKCSFRLTVLLESGPQITYQIEPSL